MKEFKVSPGQARITELTVFLGKQVMWIEGISKFFKYERPVLLLITPTLSEYRIFCLLPWLALPGDRLPMG
ncbi:hypothetical protein SAMN05216386_1869 [Nitrosospira briensis]|uniref:Uncharacterized protein n=1 Tax=Nitrosospira briensis TaxID=35799 RepID=A0A1I5BZ22_9PROT|nr:hypothetical protein SAMN05216386_1869 [Nitrosospira briensis]